MAELRALVAVKRVIDFAVKVTGPPLHLPEPRGRVLPGSLYRGSSRTSDLCRSSPQTSKSHVRAKIKDCEVQTSDPSLFKPGPSGVMTPFPFLKFLDSLS